MLRLAPDLVQVQRFYIPCTRTRGAGPGSCASDLVSMRAARCGTRARFGTVPREWVQLDGLDTEHLDAVFWYQDGQTDDRALTRAVQQSALQLGAQLRCPARFDRRA